MPPNGRLLAQDQPEICRSCTKVAFHGKNCAVAQKRESCTIFWWDYLMPYISKQNNGAIHVFIVFFQCMAQHFQPQ